MLLRPLRRFYKILPRFSTFKKPEIEAFNESFLSPSNSIYIEQMFEKWIKNKDSVPSSWDIYFSNVIKGHEPEETFQLPPSINPSSIVTKKPVDLKREINASDKYLSEVLRLELMIQGFQFRGHEFADLDPLKLKTELAGKKIPRNEISKMHPSFWGFTEADMDREFDVHTPIMTGIAGENRKWKLRDLFQTLEQIYCGKVGFEYTHISSREEKNWLRERIESKDLFVLAKSEKLTLFDRLCKNESFNQFVQNKFSTVKRFGIEGCDSFISGLGKIVDAAIEKNVEHIVFGMAHRGRLNTLAFILNKSVEEILGEFQELKPEQTESNEEIWGNSGDVKYHLGTTYDQTFENGHNLRMTILANPSHLESVNPIVSGKVRAVQDFTKDFNGDRGMGVVIHGDASFSGQGVVYESIQFSELHKYTTHGIIHVVINNQIGFTTLPKDSRSGLYCSEIAKSLDSPIFHVNADEPENVDAIMKLAFAYRQKFKKDVFIDIIGYRRYGHNELDQPGFTQPLMYKTISEAVPVFEKYSSQLIQEGIITKQFKEDLVKKYTQEFEAGLANSRNKVFNKKDWLPKPWEELRLPSQWGIMKDTGVPISVLRELNDKINVIPNDFDCHPAIRKFYEQRYISMIEGMNIDFATSEAMAFSSLLYEGYGVRLSGQDVERGTFSHRHSVLKSQETNRFFTPIQRVLNENESCNLSICNSHLSEFGVLGFEYGYSLAHPNVLVMWEAQFGDFANGAQIMIDNYIASGESKWGVQTGVVLLLPHGMDGQGPEHSSAKIERFLQLSDDDYHRFNFERKDKIKDQIKNSNIQVVQCSTSANYFHVLRRQLRRSFRKPLVCMTSKKLLRFKGATSNIEEFNQGRRFQKVYPETYPDSLVESEKIRRVILCSGQVYYDLLEKRREEKINNVAIVRLEQLAPFPYDHIKSVMKSYKGAEFIWCQEEHQNLGPWFFIYPRFKQVLSELKHEGLIESSSVRYIGRKASGSPATGLAKIHKQQQEKLLKEAFEKQE